MALFLELQENAGRAQDVARGVESQPRLPHRLRLVHEHEGVRYFNDSIATIPEAGLFAAETIVLS